LPRVYYYDQKLGKKDEANVGSNYHNDLGNVHNGLLGNLPIDGASIAEGSTLVNCVAA
jgi:hypothetical protein